jgi:hypothetical protein
MAPPSRRLRPPAASSVPSGPSLLTLTLRRSGSGKNGAEPAGGVAPNNESNAVTLGASQQRAPGGLSVYNEDEDNLPPLKYEEGPVGAPPFFFCSFFFSFFPFIPQLDPHASGTQAIAGSQDRAGTEPEAFGLVPPVPSLRQPRVQQMPFPSPPNPFPGAAQKGVPAIVVALNAVAFGACVWGLIYTL